MQIVIDIPEEQYTTLNAKSQVEVVAVVDHGLLINAIKNGTPLPKGHGRLIDADELKKTIQENDVLNMTGFNVRLCDINNTSTIIEADSEVKE